MADQWGPIGSTARRLRAHQWWNHKVPVVLATAYTLLAAGSRLSAPRLLADTVLFLVAVIGVAGFGHVVNDVFDRVPDAAAGKANTTAGRPASAVAYLLAGLLVSALLPWIWLPHTAASLSLLAAELVLLLAYAAPPIRLKDRGIAGVLADALYGFVLPIALTAAAFGPVVEPRLGRDALALALAWALLSGVRGILVHQLEDLDADKAAGTVTFAGRIGTQRTQTAVNTVLALDVASLVALMVVVRTTIPWSPFVLAGFVAFRSLQLRFLWPQPPPKGWYRSAATASHLIGFDYLNEYSAYWFPLVAVATVVARRPSLAPLLLAQLVLFHTPLLDFKPVVMRIGRQIQIGAELAKRAPRSPTRHGISPLLGTAYAALALSTGRVRLAAASEHLACLVLILHGLAWLGRIAARAAGRPEPKGHPTPLIRGRPWRLAAAATALVIAGVVALSATPTTTTGDRVVLCLLTLGAATAEVWLSTIGATRRPPLLVDVLTRIVLPAVVCWLAVRSVPGVDATAVWAVVAVAWLAITSWRGELSRPLSEAWVLDWLPSEARDPGMVEARRALVTRVFLPLESAGLAAVCLGLLHAAPVMAVLLVVFVAWCVIDTVGRRGGHWATEGDTRTKTLHRPIVALLGEFVEQWFAPLALGTAVFVHPALWPLIPAHLLLVGGPFEFILNPRLRDRADGPLAFLAERPPADAQRTVMERAD